MLTIIAQALGFCALGCNVICYQMKHPKKLLLWQLTASLFWIANLTLLGSYSGALLNLHAVIRLLVFYLANDHKWARHRIWVPLFMVSAVGLVSVTYSGILDIVALIGTLFTVYSFSIKDPAKTRLFTIPSPPCWFIYHIPKLNIGAMLNEAFVLTSIIVAIIRIDIPARAHNKEKAEQ